MKSEIEILGELDALLAQLPDDAARERAFAWLRAKHKAKPASAAPREPITFPCPLSPGFVTLPHITPAPVIEREPGWPGTLEITCAKLTGEPRRLTERDLIAQMPAGVSICAELSGWTFRNAAGSCPTTLGDVWVGETRPDAAAYGFRPLQ